MPNDRVSLLEIGPGASWDDQPNEYKLRDITRIDFGGDYEQALHLVGGAAVEQKGITDKRARQ